MNYKDLILICILSLLVVASTRLQTAEPLGPGTYQAEDVALNLPDDAELIEVEGAELGTAIQTSQASFVFSGFDITFHWRGEAHFSPLSRGFSNFRDMAIANNLSSWRETTISYHTTLIWTHDIHLTASGDPIIIDTVTIQDNSLVNSLICFWPALGVVLAVGVMVFRRLRQGSAQHGNQN